MTSPINSWSDTVLRLLQKLDSFSGSALHTSCVPFVVSGESVGVLVPALVQRLENFPEVFDIIRDEGKIQHVELNGSLTTYDGRSKAMHEVVEKLTQEGGFETLRGWRYENYEVSSGRNQPSLFKLERAATSLFGVRTYGSHLNGYIRDPQKGLFMWLARRSLTKQTFPGMLDNLAAGGIGVGIGVRETMIKECYEEASIPEEIADKVVPVGCISYAFGTPESVSMEMQYCFDLELPLDFVPKPLDGEVQEFILCDIPEVKRLIVRDDFKPNCAAITLHFLIRHGFVNPDNEPKYAEILAKMNNWY